MIYLPALQRTRNKTCCLLFEKVGALFYGITSFFGSFLIVGKKNVCLPNCKNGIYLDIGASLKKIHFIVILKIWIKLSTLQNLFYKKVGETTQKTIVFLLNIFSLVVKIWQLAKWIKNLKKQFWKHLIFLHLANFSPIFQRKYGKNLTKT